MDWLECRERRWIEMLRLFNRINNMDASRLPKLVLVWDASLELNSWFFEIQQISASLILNIHPDSDEIYDLNAAHDNLLGDQRHLWQMEANRKPKLRTYVKIHDFSKDKILAKSLLSRYQRSLISQLKFRILPLKIETDRCQGIPPDERMCRICDDNVPETEIHFLFECKAMIQVRERALTPLKANIPDLDVNFENPIDALKNLLNDSNIVHFGKFVEEIYRERQRLVYN